VTEAEFLALPLATRWEVVYRLLHDRLVTLPSPTVSPTEPSPSDPIRRLPPPRPPRFDSKLRRRGGFQFASESEVSSLEWFRARAAESAEAGGRYSDQDHKLAAELAYWIAWRSAHPAECWVGIRNGQRVKAQPPSRDPEIHPWPSRGPAHLDVRDDDREATRGFSDADYAPRPDDEEIPF
jgi:hypothetical protein